MLAVLDQAIMESWAYFANGIRQSYQESLFTGQEELQEEDVFDEEELMNPIPFIFRRTQTVRRRNCESRTTQRDVGSRYQYGGY